MGHRPSGHTSSPWTDGGRVCWRQHPHFPGFFLGETESKATRPRQDGEGQPGIMLDCVLLCFCPEPGKRTPFMSRKGMLSLSPCLVAGGHGQALLLTGLCSDSPRPAVMAGHISSEQLLLPGILCCRRACLGNFL